MKATKATQYHDSAYSIGISRKSRAVRPRTISIHVLFSVRERSLGRMGGVNMPRTVTNGILIFALCSILVPSAQAMVPVPSGIASGIPRAVQDIQYYYGQYCKEVWRCGRYACGWQQQCYFPPSGRWRRGCPRGWTIQDGWCKPYRGY